jgi:hypothetical protein
VTPDERVAIAKDYLQGARQRDVKYLPPTRLMVEVAETRHQLAQVLAVVAEQQGQVRELVSLVDRLRVELARAHGSGS